MHSGRIFKSEQRTIWGNDSPCWSLYPVTDGAKASDNLVWVKMTKNNLIHKCWSKRINISIHIKESAVRQRGVVPWFPTHKREAGGPSLYPVKYSFAVMPLALFHRVDRPFAAKHMLFCQPWLHLHDNFIITR